MEYLRTDCSVRPKRSKTSKRTSIFTVLIKPQLHIILERVLPLLTELHDSIHNRVRFLCLVLEFSSTAYYLNFCQDQSDDNPALSETSSFPKYDRDIESVLDFRDRKITIVLTLNVDGVRFKKLSRLVFPLAPYRNDGHCSSPLHVHLTVIY